MKNVKIEEVKLGETAGGFACGPVPGSIVCEVAYAENNGTKGFLSVTECCGMPNFFRTPFSMFDELLADQSSTDRILEIEEKYGFDYEGEYINMFEDPDPDWYDLLRYLTAIVRTPEGEDREFIENTTGRWLNQIEIPVSDVEEYFRFDEEEEDEDEDEEDDPEPLTEIAVSYYISMYHPFYCTDPETRMIKVTPEESAIIKKARRKHMQLEEVDLDNLLKRATDLFREDEVEYLMREMGESEEEAREDMDGHYELVVYFPEEKYEDEDEK